MGDRRGQLCLDQAMVVARHAPAQVEASVAELAVNASVPQLRRSLTKYSFDPSAATGQDNATTGGNEAGDNTAGDTPSWNGFALVEDRATAPAQLSISP